MKLTELDAKEVPRYTFDEQQNASRVVIVGGDFGIAEGIKDSLKDLKVEIAPTSERNVQTIEIPKIITAETVKIVEIPTIVKELEVKTIEIPVITVEKSVQVIEVEKPVVVTEYKTVEVPVVVKEKEIVYVENLNFKLLFVLQALTFGLIILSKFI